MKRVYGSRYYIFYALYRVLKVLIDSLMNYKEAKSSVISDYLHFNSKLK